MGALDIRSAATRLTDKILGYNSNELPDILRAIASEIGLLHIAHLRFARNKSSDTALLTSVVTFPFEWQQRYFFKQYVKIDPVIARGRTAVLPFDWDTFDYGDPVISEFFADAARHNIGSNGITIPLRSKSSHALVCFTSDAPKSEWESFKRDNLTVLQQLSVLIDSAASSANSTLRTPAVRLSRREEQCLIWAARGKTQQEIATTLGMSSGSVKSHLHSARRKLNCVNLTHAVGVAVATGLIPTTALDDAGPSMGP